MRRKTFEIPFQFSSPLIVGFVTSMNLILLNYNWNTLQWHTHVHYTNAWNTNRLWQIALDNNVWWCRSGVNEIYGGLQPDRVTGSTLKAIIQLAAATLLQQSCQKTAEFMTPLAARCREDCNGVILWSIYSARGLQLFIFSAFRSVIYECNLSM